MSDLIPLMEVTDDDLYEVIDAALAADVESGAAMVGEYAARVDWSRPERASESVRRTLGALEGLTTEFIEGRLESAAYIAGLRALLPSNRTVSARH